MDFTTFLINKRINNLLIPITNYKVSIKKGTEEIIAPHIEKGLYTVKVPGPDFELYINDKLYNLNKELKNKKEYDIIIP